MAQSIELQLTCPQCSTEFSRPAYTIVDMGDEADSEVLWQLQNGTLNNITCPKCGAGGLIPIPVLLHVPEQKAMLVFAPGAQKMSEEQLAQAIGPLLQTFIMSVPEDKRADYLMEPVVTDDPAAFQAAARGEFVLDEAEPMEDGDEADADDDDDDDDEELSPEEQNELMQRMSLVQSLFQATDSLERIGLMRQSKELVDEMFVEVIGTLTEQAEANQPALVVTLQKIMNEAEVFIASNQKEE